ncbi:uncharacterized protein LACBIDRAFT_335192 [Laccaria bicolor S238N-H82]|uniref:Predicted protein n=1 Tax=Laccaria bicolor (strain S238N-H82 / ATCC MYA-4686) TaxID=486041 RepID=B0E1M9_LACBS|nr:uncharacterized protein LACBIDRAFT_335192 [Laccaria bicolor S238N-H82]EDQ99267.1 predicted protein [Laccaria bicolor S238N-H82]|eukprot:XP_001890077.1 predicted protein [Laccaria bicolor S238N-H82]
MSQEIGHVTLSHGMSLVVTLSRDCAPPILRATKALAWNTDIIRPDQRAFSSHDVAPSMISLQIMAPKGKGSTRMDAGKVSSSFTPGLQKSASNASSSRNSAQLLNLRTQALLEQQDGPIVDSDIPNLDDNMSPTTNPVTIDPILDDIKVEYHPQSGKPTHVYHFEDYTTSSEGTANMPVDPEPWRPFRSRLDFEIAELILNTHMNKSQTNQLLSLIHQCIQRPSEFTLENSTDLECVWENARMARTSGFSKITVPVPYKEKEVPHDVWTYSLFDWTRELLEDPGLISQFHWHAERHYKFNGSKFERFIDEPWTADTWWQIQVQSCSSLPQGALPFCMVIYADKTRLSSFGSVKGYPVIGRPANFNVRIKNGTGIAGGRVLGLLPVVDEDAGETGKKGYVNFKRVVWHKAFFHILDSIRKYLKTGYTFTNCADSIARHTFWFILIASADYEEHHGLRDAENVFWMCHGSDIHKALSFDRLHAYHGGLFSDHLLSEFKMIINELGKASAKLLDMQFDEMPLWSGLNHFSAVMKTEFADGSKYEDISKVTQLHSLMTLIMMLHQIIVFAAHNILSKDVTKQGFHLLKLIRSYLELDMYVSLTTHTESTIAAGRAELLVFEKLLHEYIPMNTEKSWNFPKAHSHQHVFDDIQNKGATRNYNTKPSEKSHGSLKSAYKFHTNFKNVESQILEVNQSHLVATIIRTKLETLDEAQDSNEEVVEKDIIGSKHVSLGSPTSKITLKDMEQRGAQDFAFQDFRKKLSKFFSKYFGHQIQLHEDENIHSIFQIFPYQYLRVNYESTVDWSLTTDLLRVNPKFHNKERYDYVVVKIDSKKFIFAQLLCIFSCEVKSTKYFLALILPLDLPPSLTNRGRDRELRFTRLRSRPRLSSCFISVESIVRGALISKDYGAEYGDEYLVVDVVDFDLWLRLKTLPLIHRAEF